MLYGLAALDDVLAGLGLAEAEGLADDLRLPPMAAGGPLLNELGEVIGTLAPGGESQPAFAITADSLAPLLVSAGFGLTGVDGGSAADSA